MKAIANFCIGIDQVDKITYDSLQEKGGVILNGADDTHILGSPEITFPEVKLHEERPASIGLKLNYIKMKYLLLSANILGGFTEGEDGTR